MCLCVYVFMCLHVYAPLHCTPPHSSLLPPRSSLLTYHSSLLTPHSLTPCSSGVTLVVPVATYPGQGGGDKRPSSFTQLLTFIQVLPEQISPNLYLSQPSLSTFQGERTVRGWCRGVVYPSSIGVLGQNPLPYTLPNPPKPPYVKQSKCLQFVRKVT